MTEERNGGFDESTALKIVLLLLGIFITISGWSAAYLISKNDREVTTIKEDLQRQLENQQKEIQSLRFDQLQTSTKFVILEESIKSINGTLNRLDTQLNKMDGKLNDIRDGYLRMQPAG